MPLPNYHTARVKDPKEFDGIRYGKNKFGKGIDVIWGLKKKDGKVTTEVQSVRFASDKFTAAEAKQWMRKQKYNVTKFEPAVIKEDEAAPVVGNGGGGGATAISAPMTSITTGDIAPYARKMFPLTSRQGDIRSSNDIKLKLKKFLNGKPKINK